jgi:two-component system response regulator NreC
MRCFTYSIKTYGMQGEMLECNRETVVFADDNANVSELACELLSSRYKVIGVCLDGQEAFRRVLALQPDFAVLDISMPVVDGIAVARELRKARSNTKVIFLTVISDADYVIVAKALGHGYVLKRRLSLDLLTALKAASEGTFFSSVQ